jgi:hypothetical protein
MYLVSKEEKNNGPGGETSVFNPNLEKNFIG